MTTKFSMTRDINGYNGFGLAFSDTNYNTTLLAGVGQTLTIPSDSRYYLVVFAFESGSTIWVANNQTAAVPGASFAATYSDLNPAARLVKAGDVLSFITADTSVAIGVSLYAI